MSQLNYFTDMFNASKGIVRCIELILFNPVTYNSLNLFRAHPLAHAHKHTYMDTHNYK